MTQSEFIGRVNEVAGITFRNATLSSWENGQSSPTSDLIPVISQILQTPVMDLFTSEPDAGVATATVEEAHQQYSAQTNEELYKKIFIENPTEAFEQLLKQYKLLSVANEMLKAENQKLQGKLSASNEFLQQLINMKSG